jgi:hypothetical protein
MIHEPEVANPTLRLSSSRVRAVYCDNQDTTRVRQPRKPSMVRGASLVSIKNLYYKLSLSSFIIKLFSPKRLVTLTLKNQSWVHTYGYSDHCHYTPFQPCQPFLFTTYSTSQASLTRVTNLHKSQTVIGFQLLDSLLLFTSAASSSTVKA